MSDFLDLFIKSEIDVIIIQNSLRAFYVSTSLFDMYRQKTVITVEPIVFNLPRLSLLQDVQLPISERLASSITPII